MYYYYKRVYMFKKTLLSLLVCLGVSSSVVAGDLKKDMNELATNMTELQMGFYTNDKSMTLNAALRLKEHVVKTLGDEETITALLPNELKYKASIAINSAKIIVRDLDDITTTLSDKNMRMIKRQMRTQKALIDIQNQCFRCHNLVRDWE